MGIDVIKISLSAIMLCYGKSIQIGIERLVLMNISNFKGYYWGWCLNAGLILAGTLVYNPNQHFEPALLFMLCYVGISILIAGGCVQDAIRCGSKEISEAINNRMDKTNSIIPEVSRTSTD